MKYQLDADFAELRLKRIRAGLEATEAPPNPAPVLDNEPIPEAALEPQFDNVV